jgi:hypothetical protein
MSQTGGRAKKSIGRRPAEAKAAVTKAKSIGKKPVASKKQKSTAPTLSVLIVQQVTARLQGTLSAQDLGQWARQQWSALQSADPDSSAEVQAILLILSGVNVTDDQLIDAMARLTP